MSNPRSQSSRDLGAEVISLTTEFNGLTITVQGPVEASLHFVRSLTNSTPSHSPSQQDSGNHGEFSPTPRATTSASTRHGVEQSFPVCPDPLLDLARRLLDTSGRLSPEDRIKRAWVAGNWAGATKRGEVATPNRTPTIDLPNRLYVAIKGPGFDSPRIFSTSRAFFAAVGDLSESGAICHGFPSETEVRAYLAGAREAFPGTSA